MIVKKVDYALQVEKDASDEVAEKVAKFMKDNPDTTVAEAVKTVLRENTALASKYIPPKVKPEDNSGLPTAKTYEDAEQQLTTQAQAFSMQTGIPEDLAFKRVLTLNSNRLLARTYIQGPKGRRVVDTTD